MLRTRTKPLFVIIGMSVLLSLHSIITGYLGFGISKESESLGYYTLTLAIAWWAYEDAGKRNYHRPYEFGAFMIFGWLVLLPIYLYQTRKFGGMRMLLGILILYLMPGVLGWAAYLASPENF